MKSRNSAPDSSKIKDIPSIQKLILDGTNIRTLIAGWPFIKPFLRLIGIDTVSIEESLSQARGMIEEIEELSSIPDRSNDLFSECGWIIFESMDLKVAKKAVELAEAGDLIAAENVLLDYFSPKEVSFHIGSMYGVKAFQPRMELARKGLRDYEEGRYYASVLVVLTLLDGMVNEIQHRGFFARTVDLTAWDSIAAHSKGLQKLSQLFSLGRSKTQAEEIELPYRNGILHGMDLGYDNKTVAAKVWAALFAAREWAMKAERNDLIAPPPEKEKTWAEIYQNYKNVQEMKKKFENWQPRSIQVGVDVPALGEPADYSKDSPEYAVASFLSFWKVKNFGYMKKFLSSRFLVDVNPGLLRETYEEIDLLDWEIIKTVDENPGITEVTIHLTCKVEDREVDYNRNVRLIFEDEDNYGVVLNDEEGSWSIISWNLL